MYGVRRKLDSNAPLICTGIRNPESNEGTIFNVGQLFEFT